MSNWQQKAWQAYQQSECLFTKAQVEAALDKMAEEIEQQLSNQNPIVLSVMVGALIPTAYLLTQLDFPLEVNYVHATRYRGETSGKDLHWKNEPTCQLKDRVVLVVDDILDGGITLQAIVDYCKKQGAAKIYTAVLLDKQQTRMPQGLAKADFAALSIADGYVFGYGMDYLDYLRNAPGIFLVPKEYE